MSLAACSSQTLLRDWPTLPKALTVGCIAMIGCVATQFLIKLTSKPSQPDHKS